MVNVLPGKERIAFNELNRIEGIKDIYHVFGEYDFVVIIEVEDLGHLNHIVDLIREAGMSRRPRLSLVLSSSDHLGF